MKTLNGFKIEKTYLGKMSDSEAVVVVSTVCGKIFYSHKVYEINSEIELAGMEAAADCLCLGDGEVKSEDFYFERNVYGGASWSQNDENLLMQFD